MSDSSPGGPRPPSSDPLPPPPVRAGPPRRVTVLGAGMAGLAAAYQLARAGHQVTILEARDRPGGRVHTVRAPFSGGLYAEAGARFLPDNHVLTMAYVQHLGLPLTPLELRPVCYFRGSMIEHPNDPAARWCLPLWAEEQTAGVLGMWMSYVIPALAQVGAPNAAGWPPASLRGLDSMSFFEFLRSQGASPGAIAILRMGYLDLMGDGIETVSALQILRDLALEGSGTKPHGRHHRATAGSGSGATTGQGAPQAGQPTDFAIRGGNDLLPKALAATSLLQECLQYRSPVSRIAPAADGGGISCITADGRVVTADDVVSAIPFSVLRHVDLAVPLSTGKRRAIHRLEHTSVTRVFVETSIRFGGPAGEPQIVSTDLPIMLVDDQSAGQEGTHGILESYSGGPAARRFAGLPEAERIQAVLAELEKVYPGVSSRYVGGGSVCWDDDPWTLGAYCDFIPGDLAALFPAMGAAEGRLHFAGDHTSAMPGWIEGALASGHRAAAEVCAAP